MNIEITDDDVLRMADAIHALLEMTNNISPRKVHTLEFCQNRARIAPIESLKAARFKAYFDDVLETYCTEVNASHEKAYEEIKARLRAIADGSECGMQKWMV